MQLQLVVSWAKESWYSLLGMRATHATAAAGFLGGRRRL